MPPTKISYIYLHQRHVQVGVQVGRFFLFRPLVNQGVICEPKQRFPKCRPAWLGILTPLETSHWLLVEALF